MTLADWYDTPLYYDIIFDQDTDKEVAFLEAMMRRHSRTPDGPWRILEPACGSGRLMAALGARGHRVWGFDLNDNMTAYTQQRLGNLKQPGSVWKDRMENFQVPSMGRAKIDLAHCLVSTFKYVLEEKGAVSHLQQVAASLRKGGLYVLGIHLTDYDDIHEQHERWAGERDGVKVSCNTHTWPPDRKTRREQLRTRLRITREGRSGIQETRWEFRTYNARQVKALLRKVPELTCVACHDFHYDIHDTRELDDSYADIVLVLRRN
jgi:SAM-dependent methyltransferase